MQAEISALRTELQEARDQQTATAEEILNIAVAQGEAKIQPNRMLDDRGRKPVTTVRELDHSGSLSYPVNRSKPVSVTKPSREGITCVTLLSLLPRPSWC